MLGLQKSSHLFEELIVVFMNETAPALPEVKYPVRTYELTGHDGLPLAAARNLAAHHAAAERLIFLDVDCIPDADLVKNYGDDWTANQLLSGKVNYLREYATMRPDFLDLLNELSDPDPIRGAVQELPYELFWSLNFSCSKAVFKKIGGFDEVFGGYGGEDTDFAFSARKHGVTIRSVSAIAYHQYHHSESPPVNHLSSIVKNANLFYQKWEIWPMEGWLKSFEALELVAWYEDELKLIH